MTLRNQLIELLLANGFTERIQADVRHRFFVKAGNPEVTFQFDGNVYKKTYREYPAKEGWYFAEGRLTRVKFKDLVRSLGWER